MKAGVADFGHVNGADYFAPVDEDEDLNNKSQTIIGTHHRPLTRQFPRIHDRQATPPLKLVSGLRITSDHCSRTRARFNNARSLVRPR